MNGDYIPITYSGGSVILESTHMSDPITSVRADDYTAESITRHRIIHNKSSKGPPQLVFLTTWFPSWTVNPQYAKRVIRQHPDEAGLFYLSLSRLGSPTTIHNLDLSSVNTCNELE